MKKTDLAYYAGLFDGEGTIGVYYQAKLTPNQKTTYQLRVQLVSTNEWVIRGLMFAFGGHMAIEDDKNPKHAIKFRWFLTRKQSTNFIEAVLPYLKLKRPQAELGLQYLRHKTLGGRKSQEYLDLEADFKQQFTALNKTGRK